MNVILILIDSLNKRMLEPYGGTPEGTTPNMQRFSEEAVKFDSHFVGSLPCMPARREIFSGRKDFLWRPWGHLESFDKPLPRELEKLGYKTELITDHYHYWEENANGYLESFQGTEFIRGHELDPWRIDPVETLPDWVQAIEKYRPGQGLLYYRNVKDFRTEEDFFPAKVFSTAADWISTNHKNGPFFLQVESFDVHEPFHCPEPYRSMWTDDVSDDYNCWPPYQIPSVMRQFFDETNERELQFVRSQYKGKLTMVDKWLGHFMDRLDQLNVWDDTVVIVTSDHGHDLGERRAFGKQFPHHDSHANIPLMIRHPENKAARSVNALTSTVDLYATILDVAGASEIQAAHSKSVVPLISGQASAIRDELLFGTFGTGACCTDGEWVFIQGYNNTEHPLFLYSGRLLPTQNPLAVESGRFIPGLDYPVWKIPAKAFAAPGLEEPILIRRSNSEAPPNEAPSNPAIVKRMRELLKHLIQTEGAPPEQYARLGLA